jgi:hypothetical protein
VFGVSIATKWEMTLLDVSTISQMPRNRHIRISIYTVS